MKTGIVSSLRALLILSLAIGCSKDEPAPVVCYINSETSTGSQVYTRTFVYNNKNQVLSIKLVSPGNEFTDTYTYDANGDLASGAHGDGSSTAYTFDSGHHLVQQVYSYGGQIWSYTHNAAGQNTAITYSDPACAMCADTTTYNYPSIVTHNYTSLTFKSLGFNYSATFEYDGKKNPFKHVPFYGSPVTDNNPVKETYTGDISSSVTHAYAYNDKGYPLTRTSSGGQIITYSYDCK